MQTDALSLNAAQRRRYRSALRLNNLAAKYQSQGNTARPEKLYLRALEIKETLLGADHPDVAFTLNNLGVFYRATGRAGEARRLLERALEIFQASLGGCHPNVAATLLNLAQALKADARAIEQRARLIRRAAIAAADPRRAAKAVIRQDCARFRLRAGPSRIHRFGVFAQEPIPAGEDVIEYTGERISRRESVRRSSRGSTYVYRLDSYWRIDGAVGGSGAQLINHCCEPNCRFRRDAGRVWVASLRAIAAGEELTLDYRFPKDAPRTPCYCGAPACRGAINTR